MEAVDEIGAADEHDAPVDHHADAEDGGPHEEGCEGLYVHDVAPSSIDTN